MYINRTILGILLIFLMIYSVGPVVANNHFFKDNDNLISNNNNNLISNDNNNRLFNDNLVIAKKLSFKKSKVRKEVSVHPQCFQEEFNETLIHSLIYTEELSVNSKKVKEKVSNIFANSDYKKVFGKSRNAKKDTSKSETKGKAKKCEVPGKSNEFVRVLATAYTAQRCTARTATNTKPRWGVVAVDPKFIPLGSRIYIKNMGWFTAEDTGGKIKGKRIDIYYPTRKQAIRFGVKKLNIKVYPKKKKNYKM